MAAPQECPVDTRVLCAKSTEICPAKLALLEEFEPELFRGDVEDHTDVSMFDTENDARIEYDDEDGTLRSILGFQPDDVKLRTQLFEYDSLASLRKCAGPVEDDCPTRIRMTESAPRTKLLSMLRTLKIINK